MQFVPLQERDVEKAGNTFQVNKSTDEDVELVDVDVDVCMFMSVCVCVCMCVCLMCECDSMCLYECVYV